MEKRKLSLLESHFDLMIDCFLMFFRCYVTNACGPVLLPVRRAGSLHRLLPANFLFCQSDGSRCQASKRKGLSSGNSQNEKKQMFQWTYWFKITEYHSLFIMAEQSGWFLLLPQRQQKICFRLWGRALPFRQSLLHPLRYQHQSPHGGHACFPGLVHVISCGFEQAQRRIRPENGHAGSKWYFVLSCIPPTPIIVREDLKFF